MLSNHRIDTSPLFGPAQDDMTDAMSPFTRLPMELVQHIFNLASAASRLSCLRLSLVASWARHIALPHLLHTVVIKDHLANAQFRHNFHGPPYKPASPNFRAPPLVRNVWMEAASDRIISFFNACDNIEHLALTDEASLWLIHASSPNVVNQFHHTISRRAMARDQDLHLTIISASGDWTHRVYISDDISRRSPLLAKITHIRLADIASYPLHSDVEHFTRLSHLALPFYNLLQHGSRMRSLLTLESLKMLVVVIITGSVHDDDRTQMENLVVDIRKTDSRIYLVESYDRGIEIQEQWEEEMRGGESIWDQAARYTSEYESWLTHLRDNPERGESHGGGRFRSRMNKKLTRGNDRKQRRSW